MIYDPYFKVCNNILTNRFAILNKLDETDRPWDSITPDCLGVVINMVGLLNFFFINLVPSSEETSFLTTFYGLYFSFHYTHITHYKSWNNDINVKFRYNILNEPKLVCLCGMIFNIFHVYSFVGLCFYEKKLRWAWKWKKKKVEIIRFKEFNSN